MEDSVRTDALTLLPPGADATVRPAPVWLHSPAFDLLLIANLGWLVALVPGFAAPDGDTPLSFWQMYFLTTPHRWLTLGLVALDPDRRGARTGWFVVLAVAFLALVLGMRLASDVYLCLFVVDYVWNAWHFGAQHSGVARMYARKARLDANPWLERHGLRLFVFYTILRTAAWTTGWLEAYPDGVAWLHWVDLAILAIPVILLIHAGWRGRAQMPRRVYLWSVCLLYASLLLALRGHHMSLILALTVAAALFHAVEYLGVVTLYARRRQTVGSPGAFRTLAFRWTLTLSLLVLGLGVAALVAERWVTDVWISLNLWAALLHYAYDGMIWKLRAPSTARALGV